ncbi:hypothetical protein MHYP_G00362250 [Metynnis hypsauchen]
MEGLIPPSALNMDSDNLAKSWKAWKEEFTLYLELAMPEAEETTRVKLFYYLIGEKGRELCNTLRGEDTEARTTVKKMIEMLDEHCSPKVNETVETYRFFVRNQGQDESIEKYVTDLKSLASTCNFGQIKESLIRDRIVCGTNNAVLRERLLREDKLTLDKCVQLCRATELSRENRQTLEGRAVEEVHVIRKYASKDRDNEISCKFCGKRHERNKKKCPAFGKKCMKCGRDNHFAAMCKTRAETRKQRKPVHAVTELDSETYEDILTVTENTRTVHQVNDSLKTKQLYAGMLIGNKLVKFQIDCGASCNIIPVHLLNPDTQLEQTEKVLVMYNKTELHPIGKCKIKVRNPRNQKLYRLEFQVVDQKCGIPLLGRNASEEMKLIRVQYENILAIDSIVKKEESEGGQWTLEEIMTEFEDVFTGDGCLQGEYVIEIDKTVEPVKLPKRRVPVAMMKPLKEELTDLERRQIIAPVECSTDWISSMVAVQKPSGKLRICIDPKPLNRALKHSHFPLPTIDDILPDLSKTKVFTVCDVKQGFWHVKLEEESSYLTTFSTPFGRFRWLRMPMGISPAPEIFQRKLMQALEGLPGIYVNADDVLITGEGETVENATKDHDEKLRHFLNRCREQNIKLNADKFKLKKEEVPYIGHLLTSEGLKIDPEKVRAVTEMPRPMDVKGVQRLVGMVNYLSKFYAHLSDDCEILRQLTHKDSIWDWTPMHEEAFVRLKTNISKTPVLKYYSPEEELTLQCDASETGLGAALTQNGKPVAFTSRALTSTERGYAQIEKECLAIVFGMEKFHQCTYGRQVTVQSDHKPLENIVKKPLLSAPKRLQRMLLRLQKYSTQETYVPGRDMLLADTLSRAYLPESTTGPVEAEIETVNMAQYLPISTERLKAIRSATVTDVKLQKLIQVIQSGWPANKKNILPEVAHYYNLQGELTYQDGIIFRGERALIPDILREDIMHRIHSSHLGVEGCLRRARECVYWPGMNEHIKTYVAKYDTCRAMDIRQQKETLHPHNVQTRPWAKVDNGPQYTSQEFRQFSQRWEFEHRTSSPGYPQSNGKAESAVKMAKRIMKKAKASGRDPYLAILDHRNTPSQGLNTSPVQRLFSRRTRTLLPITDNLLKPEIQQNTQGLRNNQHRQIKYYNRTAKDLQSLKQGDRVRVQPFEPQTVWKPATVIRPVDHRSYEIKLENGGVLRWNRRHLRKENRTTPVTVPRHTHAECQQRVVTRFGRAIVRPCYLRDYTT